MKQKTFAIPKDKIQQLVPAMGWCMASDRIMVDGKKIGHMFRDVPDKEGDSGWWFFSGDESEEYVNTPANCGVYDVNTVANYDPGIIPYLQTPAPCAFIKRRWFRGYKSIEPPPAD